MSFLLAAGQIGNLLSLTVTNPSHPLPNPLPSSNSNLVMADCGTGRKRRTGQVNGGAPPPSACYFLSSLLPLPRRPILSPPYYIFSKDWSQVPSPISGVLGCPALKFGHSELGLLGCVPGIPPWNPVRPFANGVHAWWMRWCWVCAAKCLEGNGWDTSRCPGAPLQEETRAAGDSDLCSFNSSHSRVWWGACPQGSSHKKATHPHPFERQYTISEGEADHRVNIFLMTWSYLCDSPLDCILLKGRAGISIFWHFPTPTQRTAWCKLGKAVPSSRYLTSLCHEWVIMDLEWPLMWMAPPRVVQCTRPSPCWLMWLLSRSCSLFSSSDLLLLISVVHS